MKIERKNPRGLETAFTKVQNQSRTRNIGRESESGIEMQHYATIGGDSYYGIENCDLMPEFFMSLTSASDHWMFISSFGALSAGRQDPNGALFPYYSADKIADMRHAIGPITVLRVETPGGTVIWEPFAEHEDRSPDLKRNLFKSPLSNKLIFEELNSELGLSFQYRWSFSHEFGFVRSCRLENFGEEKCTLDVLDGLQNVLPPALDHHFQLRFSNLADAYKRNEQIIESGLGLFYLNSIPTDRAEPSEGLRANVVWQSGLDSPRILLSTRQLPAFRTGRTVVAENDIRGQRGAYLAVAAIQIEAGNAKQWDIVANVDFDQTEVVNLNQRLLQNQKSITRDGFASLIDEVHADVAQGQFQLESIISAADGKQLGGDLFRVDRHQSNVLFNVMRGGIPARGYRLDKADFLHHVRSFNRDVFNRASDALQALPNDFSFAELTKLLQQQGDPDLIRLGIEYLPLTFSRRHGDPTRPWNFFSINTIRADGSQNLDYQGNWRDIFQNWEALAQSFPRFTESMIFRFVNASTVDGYNPYRLTKSGFEWESPDPADPWANIGYWGDHQIIYLLKLLEKSYHFSPARLNQWLDQPICAYAQVPYRIRSYQEILIDPQSTIEFDFAQDAILDARAKKLGADGKLLRTADDEVCRVTLAEKLLVPALAKLTNFVPGGGIWLNTQRPEWNDANNALVGNGLSVVTVCHLRRYFAFLTELFQTSGLKSIQLSREVCELLGDIDGLLTSQLETLSAEAVNDFDRRRIVDQLSMAGSNFRQSIYQAGLSGETTALQMEDCLKFLQRCTIAMDQTIRINRRDDGLYHSYNLLVWERENCDSTNGFAVQHLYRMLEGQVAVLSSGLLSPAESVEVLDALRASSLYRPDQNSYLLYPDRQLPKFLEKNLIPATSVAQSALLQRLLDDQNATLVRRDVAGDCHFDGKLRNVVDLQKCLQQLHNLPQYKTLVEQESSLVCRIYETVFDHQRFTGRSGTFFGYEGLGSIYWHMVSKLALAISENVLSAKSQSATPDVIDRLTDHYRKVRDGIALTKTPQEFGAFPTDPYSHTPSHAGAQQPGMTGQVKEDILSRFTELGIRIQAGVLEFDPFLFEEQEWTERESTLAFTNQQGKPVAIPVAANSFAFTLCQTPIVYVQSDRTFVRIISEQGPVERSKAALTAEETGRLFDRDGSILQIEVGFATTDKSSLERKLAKQSHLNHLRNNEVK